MAKEYINVTVSLKEEKYEPVIAMLMDYETTGIEEKIDEIVVSLEAEKWNEEIRMSMLETVRLFDAGAEITSVDSIFEKNWNEEWEKSVPAVSISKRVGIAPECRINDLDNEIKIIINPKMSFGTGSHETTRLISRLMEKYVKPGEYWIDAGTGSGALAILAVKLGASGVFAFDNSDWSIGNSEENFILNGVEDKITLKCLDIEEDSQEKESQERDRMIPPADGICANLFLNLVMPSMPMFYESLKKSKGHLLISGIMKYNEEEIVKKAHETGFELIDILYENEWLAATFKVI